MEGENVKITLYKFTGWQGILKIPESWCRECDLLVRATERAIESSGRTADFNVKPWFLWFWKPLFQHKAMHAPILVVDGKLVSQGIVPADSEIESAITGAP
jgi:hypothetical protein